MSTTGIDNCSPYGMACTECNDLLVAPKWSAYVSKHEVRHVWACENCEQHKTMTTSSGEARAGPRHFIISPTAKLCLMRSAVSIVSCRAA